MKSSRKRTAAPSAPAVVAASLLDAEREAHESTKARLKLLELSLAHFSPHEMLGLLGKNSVIDVELGNHTERFMSVLFADIRDFTMLSEKMTPQQTFDMINSYLMTMSPIIGAHGGIIDKYIGDGIMALFPNSVDDAVRASVAMLSRLDEYNAGRRRAGYDPIQLGIGINAGILMLGMIGSQKRIEGTVISDAVNIAARLESLTKEYGISLMISEHTLYGLTDPDRFAIRYLGRVKVRGKTKGESIYEVFSHDDAHVQQGKLDSLRDFDEAVAYYQLKQIAPAQSIFERIVQEHPGDHPAKVYLERCKLYLEHQVHEDTGELLEPMDWSADYEVGVRDMDENHQHILGRIRELTAAIKAGRGAHEVKRMFQAVVREFQKHVDTEETLMMEHQYAFAAEHRIQHAAYRNSINRLRSELDKTVDKPDYLALRIQRLMVEWLVNHTLQLDRHLARFLRERGV